VIFRGLQNQLYGVSLACVMGPARGVRPLSIGQTHRWCGGADPSDQGPAGEFRAELDAYMTEPAEAYNVEDVAERVITNVLRML